MTVISNNSGKKKCPAAKISLQPDKAAAIDKENEKHHIQNESWEIILKTNH